MYDLRAVGVSLWQPISYGEAELLVDQVLGDPGSRLAQAIAAQPVPEDPEQQRDTDVTLSAYRETYGL